MQQTYENLTLRVYAGDGTTIVQRGVKLPLVNNPILDTNPSHYVADQGLINAVNVSLLLGQPLLITGEPGTGKTQLAWSVAHELDLHKPLVFHTKTTSTAKDLFYRYDALGHFHSSHFNKESTPTEQFITCEALGAAIMMALPSAHTDPFLPAALRSRGPVRSVVLIDEIDKAPSDFPNDILNEVENMSFSLKEIGKSFTADPIYRPIVVLTSNSERHLPEAFLRRCTYYYIAFPDHDRLREIVTRRLSPDSLFTPEKLEFAIEHFLQIRELALRKKPATAELLSWIRVLEKLNLDIRNLNRGEAEALLLSYSVLAKNKDDLELMAQWSGA